MKKLLLLLALLLPAYAEAVQRYVAPPGTSGATTNCTTMQNPATPATTLLVVAGCTGGGDTITMRGGTYPSGWDRNVTVSASLASGGGESSRTIINVYPGETALIQPTGAFPGIEFFNSSTNSYITFDGGTNCGANSGGALCRLIIDMSLSIGNDDPGNVGINVGGTSHMKFTNLEVKNAGNNGIGGIGNFGEISNSHLHDNGFGGQPGSGGYGIYAGSGDDWVIENNRVHGNGGYGIHLNACNFFQGSSDCNGEDHTVHRAIIRYNDIYANGWKSAQEDAGLLLGGFSEDVEAYGNVVHDNVNNAMGIQFNFFRPVLRGKVYNNTVYGNARSGIRMDSASNILVTNNLVGNNNTSGIGGGTGSFNIEILAQGSGNIYTSNGCWGTGGTTNCQSSVTPVFVNAAGGNFQLTAGSPGLNVGTDLASPYNRDMFNVLRPSGAFDLGALEYVPSGPPPTDDFARAGPGLGANWLSGYTGRTAGTIVGGQVQGTTLLSNAFQVWSTVATYDQSGTITLAALSDPSGGDVGVLLRASAPATATFYYVAATIGAASSTYIYKCIAGLCDAVAQDASVTWVPGDTIKASISGAVISVSRNGVPVFPYTDGSPLVGLYVGFGSFAVSSLSTMAADNFIIESLGGTAPTQSTGRIVKIQSGQTLKLGQQ